MISHEVESKKAPLFKEKKNWDEFINLRFKHYEPLVHIEIRSEKYSLLTARDLKDLKNVFLMRNHIFFIETGISKNMNFDIDEFDSLCDHLIIINNSTGEICATCRLLTNKTSQKFYSENEFDLSHFLNEKGVKLELGRACIHPDHRNGSLKDLLWKGVGQYCQKIKADMLFGCSSVKINSFNTIYNMLNVMRKNEFYSDEYKVMPRSHFDFEHTDFRIDPELTAKKLFDYLPPLLKSYILAGAKIYGSPAYDKEFQCTDFFTILFLNNINPSFRKRYLTHEINSQKMGENRNYE
jgi:putative hemolysin